jgi:hypothetical protein
VKPLASKHRHRSAVVRSIISCATLAALAAAAARGPATAEETIGTGPRAIPPVESARSKSTPQRRQRLTS